jgi:hypothetical protein
MNRIRCAAVFAALLLLASQASSQPVAAPPPRVAPRSYTKPYFHPDSPPLDYGKPAPRPYTGGGPRYRDDEVHPSWRGAEYYDETPLPAPPRKQPRRDWSPPTPPAPPPWRDNAPRLVRYRANVSVRNGSPRSRPAIPYRAPANC